MKLLRICLTIIMTSILLTMALPAKAEHTLQIKLNPDEQAWLSKHPNIHVGIMNAWPPMNYVDENGIPRGIGVDYLNAINKRLGGVLNVVPALFKENFDAVKSKSLDALMDITPKPDREPFFNFTTPYLTIPQIIVGHKDKPYFSGEKDLYGKSVALERGYYTVKRFKRDHPEIKIREYKDTSDCLDAVSRGEADAYVGNRAVAIYLMEKELITNLRMMGRTSQPPVPLAFGIRKDWPELAEILNKALGSLSPQEVQEIHRKWVPVAAVSAESHTPEHVQFDQAKFLLQSLGAIFACIAVIIAIVWLMKGRPRQLSIRDTLLLISFVFASLIVSSAAFVIMLLEGEWQHHAIKALNVESLNLALELKQSSDDLTRFARTYVVTGDPKYEHYFQTIIAIRDGKQAHPKKFTRSYWDHVAAGVVELDQDGEMYSIEQRMTDLGFSDEEREKLSVAKKESDDLINLEDVAMNAIKGLYKNDNGQFTIKGEPDMAMARKLLHGKEYHDAKAKIMKPVDQFFSLLEWRTADELNLVLQRNQTIILGITVLIAISIGFSIYFFFLLRRRIISPLAVLEAGAQTIKRGDYSHHIDLTSKDEVGALAKVFNSMTHRIEERTAELTEAEERSRLLLESVGDGVFGVDTKGNIIFINPIACRMLGYSSEELLGVNVHDTTHHSHSDGSSYPQEDCPMNKAYTEGRAFSVDDEVLWRKDGTNFPVEYSATPIAHGEIIAGVVVVFRDITERRQAEEKLRQNMEELERFSNLSVGREKRMINLKEEINELLGEIGKSPKYKIVT